MPTLRIALAQLNVTVGDFDGNRRRILNGILRAKAWQADLVVVPELAVAGYPPEDLLLKPSFVEANLHTLSRLPAATGGITALVGFIDRDRQGRLFNAAAVLSGGRHLATYHKQDLPNYGVFDEKRYFAPGAGSLVVQAHGVRIGVTICEDLWEEAPCRLLARAGCQLVVNLSASPYHAGKLTERQRLFSLRTRTNRLAIAYCNLVGGQDELVFDGASLVLDARGRLVARGMQFREDLVLAELDLPANRSGWADRSVTVVALSGQPYRGPRLAPTRRAVLKPIEEIYDALVLGTRDYVRKNGFDTVVLGLSGGVDSSLVACLAVDALGQDRVVGVVMPSRFSSSQTQDDARTLARTLGIRCEEISIEPCFQASLETLKRLFGDRAHDVTEQNLQARIRGNLLMALSNKFGWLVLTTGNKSEMATGYCTLYGDMAGGFAVIKDVPKTLVWKLARARNQRACLPCLPSRTGRDRQARHESADPSRRRQGPGRLPAAPRAAGTGTAQAGPIPESVLQRPPTAELAANQRDTDNLPPYEELDPILKAYVEGDQRFHAMVQRNHFKPETVRRVIRMVDHSEYKRRQGPPGVKITPKAFGRDRRMPITNRYAQS